MTSVSRTLLAGVSALAMAGPVAAQTATGPDGVAQAGDSYFIAAQRRPRRDHRAPAERARGEERDPVRRRRHVDPDHHRRPHLRRPAGGRGRREPSSRLRGPAAHVALSKTYTTRRPGRRQRPDRDRDGLGRQVEQRHDRRRPRRSSNDDCASQKGHEVTTIFETPKRPATPPASSRPPASPTPLRRQPTPRPPSATGRTTPTSARRRRPAAARTSPRSWSTGRPATASR